MSILKALETKSDNQPEPIKNKLFTLAKDISKDVQEHLKRIITQSSSLDLHDASHSEKVLSNMEALLGNSIIDEMSVYDLFFLYLSAYMHDAAMGMPEWEVRLFEMTEGIEGISNLESKDPLKRDGQEPFQLSEALRIITDKKSKLYGNFEKIKHFVFANPVESQFIKDLGERVIDYQEFRNGYTTELKTLAENKDEPKYIEYSKSIRQEYLRITHADRIAVYSKNLSSKFEETLGGTWGKSLAVDLGKVCQSHGKDFEFVESLNNQSSYFGPERANLQFVSILLRLADILHISHDRAPQSLMAETMIDSLESQKHWKFKLQGVNYTLNETDQYGRIHIHFNAHCNTPSLYYFLHQYLDWVDREIDNYFRFRQALELSSDDEIKKYKLNISERVDRSGIRADEEEFTPVPHMGFILNQKKILELLMGVGLYKDKLLFIRELYQNSLDACRCMIATYQRQGKEVKGRIEFGIGYEEIAGQKKKYLYCLDNGIGMTKEVIEKFFLQIGNSFYKSREFERRSAKLGNPFKPTSQFGIGVLSCFMVGERIEITTRSIDDTHASVETIRFSIDGPHERFYYLKPDKLDLEKMGSHGTLLKVFFKAEEENSINDEVIEQPIIMKYGEHRQQFVNKRKTQYEIWKNNIYKILWEVVGIVKSDIQVQIRLADRKCYSIIPWNEPVSPTKFDTEEQEREALFSDFFSDKKSLEYQNYLKCEAFIDVIPCKVEYQGVEIYFVLNFPKTGIPILSKDILTFIGPLVSQGVLEDGIYIKGVKQSLEGILSLSNYFLLNFTESNKPQLSIDRSEITNVPHKLDEMTDTIKEEICIKIISELKSHLNKHEFKPDSPEHQVIWNYLFTEFGILNSWLLNAMVKDSEVEVIPPELEQITGRTITVYQFSHLPQTDLLNYDFRLLTFASKLILIGKLVSADSIDVSDSRISIKSSRYSMFSSKGIDLFRGERGMAICIKADTWDKHYQEYDLVSKIWPIIPQGLYEKIGSFKYNEYHGRSKSGHYFSNSLAGIAELDPVTINSRLGIYQVDESLMLGKKRDNMVGKFEKKLNNFWMSEIHNNQELLNTKKEYCVYVFINPRELNSTEKESLEPYQKDDPEYYKGVLHGWSILFLGRSGETVIAPGILSRAQIGNKIKDEFWKTRPDIQYVFLDEVPLISDNLKNRLKK